MIHHEPFDRFAESLRPDGAKSQVLLELEGEGEKLADAIGILKTAGAREIEHRIVKTERPRWILLRFSTDDMLEAVLRLTEGGFTKMKAIDAAKHEIN